MFIRAYPPHLRLSVSHSKTKSCLTLGLLRGAIEVVNLAETRGSATLQQQSTSMRIFRSPQSTIRSRAITLIEMLVGMAITLVMMAAVVNLFANISQSVTNRRAGMEMNGQLRQVRARLYKDLLGATCPAETWQEPGDGNGYLEIIEGRWTDNQPSRLVIGGLIDTNDGLQHATSLVPRDTNGGLVQWDDANGNGIVDAGENVFGQSNGLGDYDDILALTVQSEEEPFVGRGPGGVVIESNYAEIIWYSIENPADGSLGEPGMRTVYRRVLLIAPWLNPIPFTVYRPNSFFQDNDISAHYDDNSNQWVPNTLSDLTKRENRFLRSTDATTFPHPLVSEGSGLGNNTTVNVGIVRGANDRLNASPIDATVIGNTGPSPDEVIANYVVTAGGEYDAIPELSITSGTTNPSPRPVLANTGRTRDIGGGVLVEIWEIAHVSNGPAPLALERQGEDIMLNDVLAFDLRVFDPGAPLVDNTGVVTEPSDAGWYSPTATNLILGYGAYVDLGWWTSYPDPAIATNVETVFSQVPRQAGWTLKNSVPFEGYPAVYDTWSAHYESDGIDQDNKDTDDDPDTGADESTNGLDDDGENGVDDAGERETSPPYDVRLRGMQVKIRIYERDSRQIREATVTKNFVD